MKSIVTILIFYLMAQICSAQPADYYKKVDRIVWLVQDLQGTINGWKTLGFSEIMDHGLVSLNDKTGEMEVYMASANLGGARVTWIQPISKNTIFGKFLEEYGDGSFSLMHRVPSIETMDQEISRLRELGVTPILKGTVETDTDPVNYVFFNTHPDGKYVLGLIFGPDDLGDSSGNNERGMKFTQYAFAIKDSDPVSAFWSGLGFPPLEITHGEVWEKSYYEKPADFDMNLGWQRHGNIVYEWCIPLKGPTVYTDHINSHGEGFQHMGFTVPDMDEAIRYFKDKGYAISMSGGWGDKGKKGSGRFAYVNTESIGGETIELLWSY